MKELTRAILSIPCVLYLRYESKSFKGNDKSRERVIVSLTSWEKRIHTVSETIESIIKNTTRPDLIVLNLSEEEFPNREKDLPAVLVEYQQSGEIIIMWQPGNTKAFKKFIPTLKAFPNDVIITIDDDFIYPSNFIEAFISAHKKWPNNPLSGNTVQIRGVQAHCGCASLVKSIYFGDKLDSLIDEQIIKMGMDDIFYTFCIRLNGFDYKYVGTTFFLNMIPNNPTDSLSESSIFSNKDMCEYLEKKIRKNYRIDVKTLKYPIFNLPYNHKC